MGGLFTKKAALNNEEKAESESDSVDYQSPEDYQTPKKSDYKPPEPHYQTPQPAGKERTKSQVGDLNNHEWFHGHVSRLEAEMLIEKDGQFLVRESTTNEGQYVLSGMKDGQHRHLLLVDPEGQVRTKDRTFATVDDLVAYHRKNNVPIISGGSDVPISIPVVNAKERKPPGSSFKI